MTSGVVRTLAPVSILALSLVFAGSLHAQPPGEPGPTGAWDPFDSFPGGRRHVRVVCGGDAVGLNQVSVQVDS